MKYTRKHTEEDSELQKQLGGGSNLTTGRPRPRAVQVSKRMLCTNAIAANRKPYVVVAGRVGGIDEIRIRHSLAKPEQPDRRAAGPGARNALARAAQLILSSSTSNLSVELGGITGGKPRAPYA